MKLAKINKEFLDLYYKKKLVAYELDEENGKVYLTDSYRMYIINYEDFIFRFDLFRRVTLKPLLSEDGYNEAEFTNNFKSINGIIYRMIRNDNNELYVNNKYLDLFDNFTLKIKDNKSPVLVYENEELKGLVLPIREF